MFVAGKCQDATVENSTNARPPVIGDEPRTYRRPVNRTYTRPLD